MTHEQTTIIKDEELVLKSSALQGVGTVTSVGKAIGPTGLVKAVINVTVVASNGTLDVHLEDHDDDAGGTDIPNAVFSQITAVGLYELYFRASQKYVRYVGIVGTAAVTWEMFVTTPEK
jgi:hypothetical protein